MAVFAVMGVLALSQEVCGGDHRSPPLENLGSGEYCVKGGSSSSEGCQGYLATGSFEQVKAVVDGPGACGLSHWSFDGDEEETPRPTATHKPSKTPDPTFTDIPTDTPEPSNTPRPSSTPKPSDTPKPDPSDTPKPHPTDTPRPTSTKTTQRPSATLPPVTSTATPTEAPTETASATPYVCVVCCICGTQTPIVVNVDAPDFSPIADTLKPIFYVLIGIFAMLGGSLILGVYNSIKK